MTSSIWDDQHRALWRDTLNAVAWHGATADHDPVPAALDSAARESEQRRAELAAHVRTLGGIEVVLAERTTEEELAAAARQARVTDDLVTAVVHQLHRYR